MLAGIEIPQAEGADCSTDLFSTLPDTVLGKWASTHALLHPSPDEDADDGFLAQGPASLQALKAFDQDKALAVLA